LLRTERETERENMERKADTAKTRERKRTRESTFMKVGGREGERRAELGGSQEFKAARHMRQHFLIPVP